MNGSTEWTQGQLEEFDKRWRIVVHPCKDAVIIVVPEHVERLAEESGKLYSSYVEVERDGRLFKGYVYCIGEHNE